MDKVVILNGHWQRVTRYLAKHVNHIFAFELGIVTGMLIALLVIRLIAQGG